MTHRNLHHEKLLDLLYLIIGTAALFFMIVTSRNYTALKTILLIGLCGISLLEMILIRKTYDKRELIYLGVFLAYYLLSLIWGIAGGFRFSIGNDSSLIRYYIITPIVAFLTGMIFRNNRYRIEVMLKILAWISLFAVVGDTLKVCYLSGWIPNFDVLNLFYVGNEDFINVRIRMSNEPSLMFIIPMYLYLFFCGKAGEKDRYLYGAITFFGCIYMVLSGRRALELVVGMTFVIILMVTIKRSGRNLFKTMILLLLAGVVLVFALNKLAGKMGIANIIETAFKSFAEIFQQGASEGVSKRIINMQALHQMFLDSPIIGHGLNAYAIRSLASNSTLWSYEVYFNALLMQTGLIGIGILFTGVFSILKHLRQQGKILTDERYIGCMVGMIMFVFSSATNPIIVQPWVWCVCAGLSYAGLTMKEENLEAVPAYV